ncbi:SRPBCC domain-containing protein [Pleomorphomonas sp. PLEO]|uniref:SRPBCC domain-containing protein n=1 Tax=Pleomorphomonas sp. PLEO TaxID=3239306 RepID=UPI00351E8F83
MTDKADRELVLQREIPFRRELVWKAMTDPVHVNMWWGPNGFTSEAVRMDFRIGGAWSFDMLGPDGTRYPNHSMFKKIVPPSKLVFDVGDGKKVWFEMTVTLSEKIGGTLVTLRQLYETAALRDEVVEKSGAVEGGKQHLAKLEAYIGQHFTK